MRLEIVMTMLAKDLGANIADLADLEVTAEDAAAFSAVAYFCPGGDLHKPRQMILRFAGRYGITPEDIGTLVALLRERAEMVVVSGALYLCRDPDDDLVIGTAVNGGADALVTRDDDLKASPRSLRPFRSGASPS